MKSFRIFAVALAAAGLGAGVTAATATAAPGPQPYVCNNAYLESGTYPGLTVKGWCETDSYSTVKVLGGVTLRTGAELTVGYDATLRVQGNMSLQAGSSYSNYDYSTTRVTQDVSVGSNATLNSETSYESTLRIDGNLGAASGSYLGLGCTEAHPSCVATVDSTNTAGVQPAFQFVQTPSLNTVTIGGNATLSQVLNATIDGAHIGGNLTITGGGDPAGNDPNGGFMPIKDSTVGGQLRIESFHGFWWGVIRDKVGQNVILTGNSGTNEDSSEVVANKVGLNLVCSGNTPHAQYGDALEGGPFPGYGPNKVGGQAYDECAALTHLTA